MRGKPTSNPLCSYAMRISMAKLGLVVKKAPNSAFSIWNEKG